MATKRRKTKSRRRKSRRRKSRRKSRKSCKYGKLKRKVKSRSGRKRRCKKKRKSKRRRKRTYRLGPEESKEITEDYYASGGEYDFKKTVIAPWDKRRFWKYKLPDDKSVYKNAIANYTFGNSSHDNSRYTSFSNLLDVAKLNNIPVFILTSGSPDDAWATLTILDLEDSGIQGVYGCGNNSRKFGKFTKYKCIRHVLKKLTLPCDGPVIGYLFDDNDYNRDIDNLCPSIQFEKIDGSSVKNNYDENIFNNDIIDISPGTDCLAMTSSHMNEIITQINSPENPIKVLFFDWDCVIQTHHGPFPLSKYDYLNKTMIDKGRKLLINRSYNEKSGITDPRF